MFVLLETNYLKYSIVITSIFFSLQGLYYIQSLITIGCTYILYPAIIWSLASISQIFCAVLNIFLSIAVLYLIVLLLRDKSSLRLIIFFLTIYFPTIFLEAILGIALGTFEFIFSPNIHTGLVLGVNLILHGLSALYSGFGVKTMIVINQEGTEKLARKFNPIILIFFAIYFFVLNVLFTSPVLNILDYALNWIIFLLLAGFSFLYILFRKFGLEET